MNLFRKYNVVAGTARTAVCRQHKLMSATKVL